MGIEMGMDEMIGDGGGVGMVKMITIIMELLVLYSVVQMMCFVL